MFESKNSNNYDIMACDKILNTYFIFILDIKNMPYRIFKAKWNLNLNQVFETKKNIILEMFIVQNIFKVKFNISY